MIKFLSEKVVKSFGIIALAGLTTAAEAQVTHAWSPAGPIYNAGRARNIVIDKSDASGNTMYVGSTSSGVFKSTDGGVDWAPLNDQGTVRNISYMAQGADNTIYAGTGEGFLRPSQKAKALPGTGLYKLAGGALINVADSTKTGMVINKVACHPTLANQIALATNKGILLSTDFGASYTNGSAYGITTIGTGLDIKFDINGIMYASIGSEVNTSTVSSTVWKASSSLWTSVSFANITPSSPSVNGTDYGRIELATAPSNAGVIYASCAAKFTGANASPTLMGLFVSYDGGANWGVVLVGSPQLDPTNNYSGFAPSSPITRASGDYAHIIVVDPTNYNQILFGSYSLYAFQRTGGTDALPVGNWYQIGEPLFSNAQIYLHQNIHDIKLVNSKYYITTDAGIFRSVDGLQSFQPFYKGLVTGQFNSVSIERFPLTSTGNTLSPYSGFLGGTGGNGATYFRGNYPNVNLEVSSIGGDIFNCEFAKMLPSAAILSDGRGTIYRTSDIKTAEPSPVNVVKNTATQNVIEFDNTTYSVTGSPFKLFEYYAQLDKNNNIIPSPDSLVFYNDTTTALSSIASLTTTTDFTFSVGRPQPKAKIDYISIKMIKVINPAASAPTPSALTSISNYSVINTETLGIQMSSYTVPLTGTLNVPIVSVNGYTTATPLTSNSVIINSDTKLDEIRIKLSGPLYATQPTSAPSVTNIETYVRMRATVFYKYNSGDSISILDDNISTLGTNYSDTTSQSLVWTQPPTSTLNVTSNKVQKYKSLHSARLAIPFLNGGVFVSKNPLALNDPISLVKVSASGARTCDSLGAATNNTISILGNATMLEWGKTGTDLYYATDSNAVYRVSHLFTILDSTSKSYSGKLQTGIFTYSNTPVPPSTVTAFNTPNPNSPYRTTFLGKFSKKITSMTISSSDTLMTLTFDDPTGTLVRTNSFNVRKCNYTNINFVDKTGSGMTNVRTYCNLMEKGDPRIVYVGTDNGLYYTSDITAGSPSWKKDTINAAKTNWLPNVQIFDIKQQTMNSWECYNSGQIYVATNGRGIWTNNDYYAPTVVSVKDIVKSATESNLKLFPNPANGDVNLSFTGFDGETASINILDINGRIISTQALGKLNRGEVNSVLSTESLTSGVYIVNVVSDSGMRRVSKLIVTK